MSSQEKLSSSFHIKFFDSIAVDYEGYLDRVLKWARTDRDFFTRATIRVIQQSVHGSPKKILDFGCGTGRLLKFVADAFPEAEIHGYDPSAKSIQVAQQDLNAKASLLTDQIETLVPAYDLIIVSGVFHHIPEPLWLANMKLIKGLLNKSGKVIVFELNPLSFFTQILVRLAKSDEGATLVFPWKMKSLLKLAGFIPQKTKHLFFFPQSLSIFAPLERFLSWLPFGAKYFLDAICRETLPYDPYAFNLAEVPGQRATEEQLSLLYSRYAFAETFCHGKDVLEIACGPGVGMPFLAEKAQSVTGGDLNPAVLEIAKLNTKRHPKIKLFEFDAEAPPFGGESFDTAFMFEAIYLLESPERFLKEAHRLLRPKGTLLVSGVNPDWQDFHPTPFATRYLNFDELQKMTSDAGFKTSVFGIFPTDESCFADRVRSTIKKSASFLGAIPNTTKAKEPLKRLFYGRLTPIPPVLARGMFRMQPVIELHSRRESSRFKLLCAVGKKV